MTRCLTTCIQADVIFQNQENHKTSLFQKVMVKISYCNENKTWENVIP